jgi:membrane protein YdbS with pleckstrin-like domain
MTFTAKAVPTTAATIARRHPRGGRAGFALVLLAKRAPMPIPPSEKGRPRHPLGECEHSDLSPDASTGPPGAGAAIDAAPSLPFPAARASFARAWDWERQMDAPLDRFRSSTVGWLRGTLAGWGTVALALAGIILAAAGVGAAETGRRWLPLLLTAIALAIVAYVWLRNLAATYEVTEERLVIRRGIFMKSIDEIELYRIKDIRLNFSLVNQLADIGTLGIASSDETTRGGDLVIPEVAQARERRETLRRLVDTARQKRRVREFDMHDDG